MGKLSVWKRLVGFKKGRSELDILWLVIRCVRESVDYAGCLSCDVKAAILGIAADSNNRVAALYLAQVIHEIARECVWS